MEAKLTLDISGMPEVLRRAVSIVRKEVADAVRAATIDEPDGRIVMRLNDIAGQLDGTLASVEMRATAALAPLPNETRRDKVIAGDRLWATKTLSEKP